MSTSAGAVLIVGPSWVGDMVMAQSLFKLIKERSPELSIDVLAPPWSNPLLRQMREVRAAIEMPIGHGTLGLGLRRRLGRRLFDARYHQAIVLPRSFKSALVPWWARIPRRTGYLGELRYGLINDRRTVDERHLPRTVERYVALGLEPGEPFPRNFPLPKLSWRLAQRRQPQAAYPSFRATKPSLHFARAPLTAPQNVGRQLILAPWLKPCCAGAGPFGCSVLLPSRKPRRRYVAPRGAVA